MKQSKIKYIDAMLKEKDRQWKQAKETFINLLAEEQKK